MDGRKDGKDGEKADTFESRMTAQIGAEHCMGKSYVQNSPLDRKYVF